MGEAIHDIITTMDNSLGEDAGYFFIKEIRRNLDDEYKTSMDNMGVDLGLMQLEREVRNLEKSITHHIPLHEINEGVKLVESTTEHVERVVVDLDK